MSEVIHAKFFIFVFNRPIYPQEEEEVEDNAIDDEAELDLNKVEEEMAEDLDDEFGEEESLLDLDALKNKKTDVIGKPENIMVSNTTAAEWKLELEKVLPQLKVTIRTDNKVLRLIVPLWQLLTCFSFVTSSGIIRQTVKHVLQVLFRAYLSPSPSLSLSLFLSLLSLSLLFLSLLYLSLSSTMTVLWFRLCH